MQRVLPWTLLIVGLLIGYVVGLGSRPAPVTPTGPSGPSEPRQLLPFRLAQCKVPPACLGVVDFPREVESPAPTPAPSPMSVVTQPPAPSGSPTPKPTARPLIPFNLISNMSANRSGGRFVPESWAPLKSGGTTWVEVMSLPEDPADLFTPQRLQTLYENVTSHGIQYSLVTCILDPQTVQGKTPSCVASDAMLSHH